MNLQQQRGVRRDPGEGVSGAGSGTRPAEMPRRYLRRIAAVRYVQERWGLPCQPTWLAKLAVVGGGPVFRKCGRFPVYEEAALDEWAQGRLSAPMRSTSDAP